jgi:hypothetical protein
MAAATAAVAAVRMVAEADSTAAVEARTEAAAFAAAAEALMAAPAADIPILTADSDRLRRVIAVDHTAVREDILRVPADRIVMAARVRAASERAEAEAESRRLPARAVTAMRTANGIPSAIARTALRNRSQRETSAAHQA